MVVAAVSDETRGAPTRTTGQADDRRHRLDERDQLGDVVAVAARERPGERDPAGVDQEVVLEPGRPLSTGLGPVSEPPFLPGSGSNRRSRAPTRAHPPRAAARAGARAAAPRRLRAATRRGGASRSPRSRSQAPGAGASTRSPCAGQRGSPAVPAGRATASGLGSESAAPSSGEAARRAPTTRRRRSTAQRPLAPLSA